MILEVFKKSMDFFGRDEHIAYFGIPDEQVVCIGEPNEYRNVSVSDNIIEIAESVTMKKISGNVGYYRFDIIRDDEKDDVIKKMIEQYALISSQVQTILKSEKKNETNQD